VNTSQYRFPDVKLLAKRYVSDLDWSYLEKKAALPENDTVSEILELKKRVER